MLTLGELAVFMEASARRVKPELKEETEHLLHLAEHEAKAMIGQGDVDGWAPLSEATLQGFRHPDAGWIKGKIELGYTGQVSEDDPLLREGGMRDSIKSGADETARGVEGILGSEDRVALWQEMGTHDAKYPIPPRPFLAPAMTSLEAKSHAAFGNVAVQLLTPGIR